MQTFVAQHEQDNNSDKDEDANPFAILGRNQERAQTHITINDGSRFSNSKSQNFMAVKWKKDNSTESAR